MKEKNQAILFCLGTQTISKKKYFILKIISKIFTFPHSTTYHTNLLISLCMYDDPSKFSTCPWWWWYDFQSFFYEPCLHLLFYFTFFFEQKFYHCKWTLNVIKINRKIALHPTLCILFYIYIHLHVCTYIYWSVVGWALSIKKKKYLCLFDRGSE